MEPVRTSERRRFARAEINSIPIKYRAFRNDSFFISGFHVGRGIDISVGGLKWAVGRHMPIGTKLDMEIELNGPIGVYVVAQVVGSNDQVVNGITHRYDRVTFLEMEKDVQDQIMRQVFENLKKRSIKK